MEYQTAKLLKDEGFPQDTNGPYVFENGYACTLEEAASSMLVEGKSAYAPTLEELIEACPREYKGDSFDLTVLFDGWYASYQNNDTFAASLISKGETPTEAVARLYLALNKDPKHPVNTSSQ